MPTYSSRDEAIDFDLIPALRALGLDPDEVNLDAIARETVDSTKRIAGAVSWQNNQQGERLRRIADSHRR